MKVISPGKSPLWSTIGLLHRIISEADAFHHVSHSGPAELNQDSHQPRLHVEKMI